MTECYKWWLPKFFLLLPFVSVFSVVSQCCWAPVDCLGSQCWMSQPWSLFAELPRQQNRSGEGLEEAVLWHSRDVWHWSGWCLGWGGCRAWAAGRVAVGRDGLGWALRHRCASSSPSGWACTSRWVRTALSPVEFPAFCFVKGDGAWPQLSCRALCFEGLWCLPFCATGTPWEELQCQYSGVKSVSTFMPAWFHPASNKDLWRLQTLLWGASPKETATTCWQQDSWPSLPRSCDLPN